MQRYVSDPGIIALMQRYVSEYHVEYPDIYVTSIYRSGYHMFINVGGMGKYHCGIAGQVHSNNRIYFRVYKNRFIEQLCHNDTCKTAKHKTKQHPIDAETRLKLGGTTVKLTGSEDHLEFINNYIV